METPNGPLQPLNQMRSSAMKDVGSIEARLTRLSTSTATTEIKIQLNFVSREFREYITTLDEAIVAKTAC